MTNAIRRKLTIPNWYPPYLEKNHIHDLFHELAWELVIQQPNDHILFLKQLLVHGMDRKDVRRIIIISPPQINPHVLAKQLAEELNSVVITYQDVVEAAKRHIVSQKRFVATLNKLLIVNDCSRRGWIFPDFPKTTNDAKAMQQFGILPTNVFQIIPPFSSLLYELNIKKPSSSWVLHRQFLLSLRETYKRYLTEIIVDDKNTSEITEKCLYVLQFNKRYKAPIIPKVLLIGALGSGRRTQAKLLASKFGLIHIDFENIFMQSYQSRTYLGHMLRAARDKVSEHPILLTAIVHKRILQKDCLEKGWVLTGFPNTYREMKYLDMLDTPPNRILFLEMDLNICQSRLKNIKMMACEAKDIYVNQEYFKIMFPHMYSAVITRESMINHMIDNYCQNYNSLYKYCCNSASVINGNQSVQWVAETINFLMMGPIQSAEPRCTCQNDLDFN